MGEVDTVDGDHVESDIDRRRSGHPEPTLRESANLRLLGRRHRRRGTAVPIRLAGLDLTEDDQVVAADDQIDVTSELALGRPPIGIDDLEPEGAEVSGGTRLSPRAAGTIGEIASTQNSRFSRTLAALPTRSRR